MIYQSNKSGFTFQQRNFQYINRKCKNLNESYGKSNTNQTTQSQSGETKTTQNNRDFLNTRVDTDNVDTAINMDNQYPVNPWVNEKKDAVINMGYRTLINR